MPARHFPLPAGTAAPTGSTVLAEVAPTAAHMLALTDGTTAGTGFARATALPGRRALAAAPNGVMVPFYRYPNNPYTDPTCLAFFDLLRRYHDVPVIVVANPASGPGTVKDLNWSAFIRVAQACGATVLGYVSTGYAARGEAAVKADIDAWGTLYNDVRLDGIFLDEQTFETGPGGTGDSYVQLYKRYADHARAKGYNPVVANPGVPQQAAYFKTDTGDIIVTYESSTYPTEALLHGNFVDGPVDFNFARRASLVYGQSALNDTELKRLCKYARWIYVTHDALPNPWDELPPYLEAVFAALDAGADTVRPAGTGTVAVPLVNVLAAPRRPEFYGAKLDGTTDDTTAWRNMFTDIATAGGGEVRMPPGRSRVAPNALRVPSNCAVRGAGKTVSTLVRAADGVLLDVSGTAAGYTTHSFGVHLDGIGLDGSVGGGTLLRSFYASQHTMRDMLLRGGLDAALRFVETWDSNYTNIFCEGAGQRGTNSADDGSTLGSEVVQFWGATAGTGFGASADSNNALKFINLHVEIFKSSAISMRGGVGRNTNSNHSIYFNNCKFETGPDFSSQYVIHLASLANNVMFRNTYGFINGQANAAFANNTRFLNCYVDDFLVFADATIGAAIPWDAVLRFWTPAVTARVENVVASVTMPTRSIIYIEGGNQVSWARVAATTGSAAVPTSPVYAAS